MHICRYKLDENTGMYLLEYLKDVNDSEFWGEGKALEVLSKALEGLPFDEHLGDFYRTGLSVTELEMRYVLQNDCPRVVWARREFTTEVPEPTKETKHLALREAKDNMDVSAKLSALKEKMEADLAERGRTDAIHHYQISAEAYQADASTNQDKFEYGQKFEAEMKEVFMGQLKIIIRDKIQYHENAYGSGVSGMHFDEMIQQTFLCLSKTQDFIGREELVKSCVDIVDLNKATLLGTVCAYGYDLCRQRANTAGIHFHPYSDVLNIYICVCICICM